MAATSPRRDEGAPSRRAPASLLRFWRPPTMGLFDVTSASLEVALRGAEQRQSAISNNIANVNTPGFKRSDVTFEQALASAIAETGANEASVRQVAPTTVADSASSMRADGNNVDIDRESAALAQTQ